MLNKVHLVEFISGKIYLTFLYFEHGVIEVHDPKSTFGDIYNRYYSIKDQIGLRQTSLGRKPAKVYSTQVGFYFAK